MGKAAFVCLLLTAAAAAAADDRGVGDACRAKGGAEGACLPIGDCPSARDALRRGEAPTTCFYQRHTPIVCCPGPGPNTSTPSPTPSPAQQQRVASRMCSVYAGAVFRFQNVQGQTVKLDQCAKQKEIFIASHGGEKTFKDEYPHMALLGYGAREQPTWGCGGSLISERFVLTAAHCIFTELGKPTVVRLGELNLNTNDESKHEDFAVAQTIPHPDYKDGAYYNDIGLLRLARDAVFTSSFRPACLHTRKELPQQTPTATGWGITEWVETEVTNHLMAVILPIQEGEVCKKEYRTLATTARLSNGIEEETMVCAGTTNNATDTCKGDSGGPLQVKLETPYCMYSVVGITSFGKGHCGLSKAPAIYTRVSHYVPWIEGVVWPNKR